MEDDQVWAILNVFSHFQSSHVEPPYEIDLSLILHNLKRLRVITEEQNDVFSEKYSSGSFGEHTWRKVISFLSDICGIATFEEFVCALYHSNYFEFCKALQTVEGSLIEEPSKQALSNDERLVTYYTSLRKMADNNCYHIGNKYQQLENVISHIDRKINACQGHSGPLQYLINKRIIAYFMLAQQYLNIRERNKVMKRMRDVMPKGVDRTVFDIIYHSLMSINCAIQGNATSSEKHEQTAMHILGMFNSRFLDIITSFGSLYQNGVLFLHSRSSEYLTKTKTEFNRGMERTADMSSEERLIQRSVAVVEHVRSLLGINLDCTVCDITDIETVRIQRARDILCMLEEDQLTKRRRMKFFLNKGRLYELCDVSKAAEYVQQALELADNETEVKNMKKYMEYLQAQGRARR